MTEVDARAAIAKVPKKVHFANRRQVEKASFLAISLSGNRPFFASRQQGAEIVKEACFAWFLVANQLRNPLARRRKLAIICCVLANRALPVEALFDRRLSIGV